MRLFEAIIEANHRAVSGDKTAGVHVADYADALPITALSCIDVRLNPLLPEVLGIREDHFIWLRNAGNIITSATSSTMRSLALACAIKGGKEIAIIGHTDCLVGHTSIMQLTDRFKALGIDRTRLPENLTEFFGVFASETQNVLRAVEFVRHSPLIGPRIPVHGLLVDIRSGRLEWLVNGYQALDSVATRFAASIAAEAPAMEAAFAPLTAPGPIKGGMESPETKIGEASGPITDWIKELKMIDPPQKPQPHPEPLPEPPPEVKAVKGKPAPIPVPPPLLPRRRFGVPRKAWWE